MKFKHGWSLLIFIVLTVLITWPLVLHPAALTAAGREEFLLSYLMNWDIQALTTKPGTIFQVPFFYPLKDTLAFSDPLLTSAILALPFVKIFHQPFLAYSFNLFLSFVLNGFSVYLVVYLLTKHWWASLISGALFAFSIGQIDTIEHLQVLTMYWIPLGIYFLIKFFRQPSHRYALLVTSCFLCQILNTIFLGYVFIFTLSIFTLIAFIKRQIKRAHFLLLGQYFLLAFVVLFLVFQPYLRVARTWQAGRSLKDVFAGSAYFLEYFYPTHSSRLETLAQAIIVKHPWPAYLGAVVSILGALSLMTAFRSTKTKTTFLVFLTGLVMSFGPYFQIIKQKLSLPLPLPYWLSYYLIPGFKSMRVPQRWSHLALLGLSLLIGLWLAGVFKKIKPMWVKLFSLLIIILIVTEIRLPLFVKSVPTLTQIPPVYPWLLSQQPSIVLELPIQTWVMPLHDLEIERLYYHSFLLPARHVFINGYSGFEPPEWTKTISILRTLPIEEAISQLKVLQVKLIIIHEQEMLTLYQKDKEALPLKATLETIRNSQQFIKVYGDETTSVYQI
ncbi:MAG: hypothetical protein NTZ93_02745 [Candidatus Beckwithbacteria bacterium]|nr:hypothetical protein [Candidatus Beckwithbacteria bacterium]